MQSYAWYMLKYADKFRYTCWQSYMHQDICIKYIKTVCKQTHQVCKHTYADTNTSSMQTYICRHIHSIMKKYANIWHYMTVQEYAKNMKKKA